LLATGFYRTRLRRDRFPGVAVLCYHGIRHDREVRGPLPFEELHVRASELEGHCRLIREECHPISLRDWLAADQQERELPSRPVLVTFDDGYESVFTRAKAILETYQIPAVVFVSSGAVRRGGLFWYDRAAIRYDEASVETAKSLPHDQWQQWEQAIVDVEASAELRVLTPAQVGELAAHPLFEIGGHTVNHPILANADEPTQRREIEENRRELEAWTGSEVSVFAYPNGRPGIDYTERTTMLVCGLGYRMAFSTRSGFASIEESRWERPRFLMLSGITTEELAHRLAFSWRRKASAESIR
jgi:peptidoglycan/xylan/chitin deacetylase (PgdA/CDA1 family)